MRKRLMAGSKNDDLEYLHSFSPLYMEIDIIHLKQVKQWLPRKHYDTIA